MARSFDGTDDVIVATIPAIDTGDWTVGAIYNAVNAGEANNGAICSIATSGAVVAQRLRIALSTGRIEARQTFATTNAVSTRSCAGWLRS